MGSIIGCLKKRKEPQNNKNQETDFYLPEEVIYEILLRLPLKSVSRCKCVCKLWCEIVDEHKFIMDHMDFSEIVYEYIDANANTQDMDEFESWFYLHDEFESWFYLHGLVVESSTLTKEYRVRNYATNKVFDLNILHHDTIQHISIFYLPITDSYKLVYVHGQKGMEYNGGCQVLTVGADLTWRTLDNPGLHNLGCESGWLYSAPVSTNDVFFVTGLFDDDEHRAPEIVCLEMESEQFVNLTIPQALFSSWENVVPFPWDNNLALGNLVEQELHVWVLEDYKKQQWAERERVIDLSFLNKYPNIIDYDLTSRILITDDWLSFFPLDFDYHIESKTMKTYSSLPQGKLYKSYYKQSLVDLEKIHQEGIQAMEVGAE